MTGPAGMIHDYHLGLAEAECPYRGLQPYTELDADFFFGREGDRDLVVANIMASPLTVLCGPSGVGKSSLLRAGVLGELRRGSEGSFSFLAVDNVVVAYFASWRDDPLLGLGRALYEALPEGPDRDEVFRVDVPFSASLVQEIVTRFDADVYLLLDQLEDLELYHRGSTGDDVAREIGTAITTPALRVGVLFGIREDALAKLNRFEQHVPAIYDNYLRLDYLSVDAARSAIERPIEQFNRMRSPERQVRIEPALVDRLLVELQTGRVTVPGMGQGTGKPQPGTIETPFLQLVMTRLWIEEVERRGSSRINLSTLVELGGVEHIVRSHLDDVMSHLTPDRRDLAAVVFGHLVTPSGTKIAHSIRDLAEYSGTDDLGMMQELLEQLSSGRQRILRPVPPPVDHPGPPRYEILHDVMAPAVLDWRRRQIVLRQREAAEREFIEATAAEERSHRETRRRLRRAQLLAGTLALLLVVCLCLAWFSKQQSDRARRSEDLTTFLQTRDDPARSLEAAVDGWQHDQDPAAGALVRRALDSDRNRLTLAVDTAQLNSAEFSPDGNRMLSAGTDGTARLFDNDGNVVRTYRPSDGTDGSSLFEATFSPDGALITTTASTGRVLVYETATGAVVGDFGDFAGSGSVARWVVVDGAQLMVITSANGDPPQLWDPASDSRVATYGDQSRRTYDADVSADGTRLVTSGKKDGKEVITIWDVRSGTEIASTPFDLDDSTSPHFLHRGGEQVVFAGKRERFDYWNPMIWDSAGDAGQPVATDRVSRFRPSLVVSDDGERIAFAADKHAVVFDARTADGIGGTPDQASLINDLTMSRDGRWLAIASADGSVTVWLADQLTAAPLTRLLGHKGAVTSVEFNPRDSSSLVSAGVDGALRTWELPERTILTSSSHWIQDADVSADGGRIVTAEDNGNLRFFDRDGQKLDNQPLRHDGVLTNVALTADGRTAAAIMDPAIAPSAARDGEEFPISFFEGHDSLINGLAVSNDDDLIAAGDWRNRVVLWSLATGKIVHVLGDADQYNWMIDVAFVPNSNLIAGASGDGTVRIWDPESELPVKTIGRADTAPVTSLAFSDDGEWMASITSNNTLHIVEWKTGDTIDVAAPGQSIYDVAFSPDGSLLAAGGSDGAIYVWNRSSGELQGVLQRHGEMINSVDFIDDETFLTASDDGTAAIIPCGVACADMTSVIQTAMSRVDKRTPN